ncbi:MAG: hypothetical protein ACOCP8_00020 [archaeon]
MLELFELCIFLIVFIILIRETIIDIKTEFVPNNIVFSIYTVSFVYIISKSIFLKSYSPLLDALLGFLFAFGIPFGISFIGYLSHKLNRKKDLKELIKCKDKSIDDTSEQKKIPYIIKAIVFDLLLIALIYILYPNNFISIQFLHFVIITELFVILAEILYYFTRKISYAVSSLSLLSIFIFIIVNNYDMRVLTISIIALIIEFFLYIIFKPFDDLDKLIKEEKDMLESDDFDGNYGGIGGGDILIFGAIGIIFGIKDFLYILLFSCFSQILIIFSYYIFSSNFKGTKYIPFLPGITIGFFIFISGADIIDLKANFELFINYYL